LWRIARPPYKKAFPGEIACGERDDWLVPGINKTDLEALCGGRVSSTGSGVGQSAGASGCNLPEEFVDVDLACGVSEEPGKEPESDILLRRLEHAIY
jgi:hypothetical protein